MANSETMAASQVAGARIDAPAVGQVPAGNVFTVRGLSFAYRDGHAEKRVFDGLDLDIAEGEVTTFIGANGCGKSTLFNLLTKNLKPDAGSIFLRGGNVEDLRLRDFARLVAIVHQRNVAPPGLSVRKLVEYGRAPFHTFGHAASTEDDERIVANAIKVAGLADIQDAPVSRLSGGQMQRAWIGMALAQDPGVLLLDEPTTFLDVRYQLDVLHLVRSLNRDYGITVIMVLHDMNQALQYSDRIVALANGRIAAQGAPTDVVDSDLIEEVYGVRLDVVDLNGSPFVLAV